MTVTIDKLARALEKRLGMDSARAASTAQRVMSYFGFENVIIDNAIDPEDRRLFYELHDAGVLQSSLDTVVLPSGKSWRIFYWEIDERDLDRILGAADPSSDRPVYSNLPPEAWRSRAAGA